MSVHEVEDLIELLTAERAARWRSGQSATDVEESLDEAWSRLRSERAAVEHGEVTEIIQRARVDRELEKLIQQEDVSGPISEDLATHSGFQVEP